MREVRETGKLQLILAVLFLLLLALGIAVVFYGIQDPPFGDQKTTTYKDKDLRISLTYPQSWQESERSPRYFRGPNTFLRISGKEGNPANLQGVCQQEAALEQRKYGQTPSVQFVHIAGQRGCYIFGSADGQQSAVIVKTKRPVYSYDEAYRFVLVETSKQDVLPIARGLKILS